MKNKHDIINRIIQDVGAVNYIEIGYGDGANFNLIECSSKKAVDPCLESKIANKNLGIYIDNVDSDTFYKENNEDWATHDVVFIDGDHTAEQVRKDIVNAMKCNAKAIVLHDVIPHSKEMQEVPRNTKVWTGNCWRSVVGFIESYPDVNVVTYRADYGLTVIYPNGKKVKKHFENMEMTYEAFKKNEVELLNIID